MLKKTVFFDVLGFKNLFDGGMFEEIIYPSGFTDPLNFKALKTYKERVSKSMKSTGLNDAIRTGVGKLDGNKIVISLIRNSWVKLRGALKYVCRLQDGNKFRISTKIILSFSLSKSFHFNTTYT